MGVKPRVLIISPHNDDALIGCYQFLTGKMTVLGVNANNSELYVFFDRDDDMTFDRWREALEFAKAFELKVLEREELRKFSYDIVFAPSPESKHYKHKYWSWASLDLEAYARVFYSIDMDEWWVRPLHLDLRREKKKVLDTFFPLESELWEKDGKYYIFEGYVMLL